MATTSASPTAARRNRTLDDALLEARATYVARRPKSKAQHQAARTVMPGGNTEMSVELIQPIAMEEGLRFAIREGGRTVGAGRVTKIVK